MDLQEKLREAKNNYSKNKIYFKKLQKHKKEALDAAIHPLHEEVFKKTDCLKCANCCITTGPLLTDKDIERISKNLRMKPAAFMEEYLRLDEDNDYVFKSMPCPFLGGDHYCSIYDVRPKACREYPHTDRKNMKQILNITLKNTLVCPAVNEIFEKLRERIG